MRRAALAAALLLAACGAPPPAPPAAPMPGAAEAPPAGLPTTDIFLLPLHETGGEIRVGAARNVTDRDGYDNQPAFTPDGRAILFTTIGADAQADIARHDIRRRATRRLTATPESEYSPTPLPGGRGFSTIRVESDSTQRLWRFDDAGRRPRLVLERVAPVGYHAWADEHTLALFVLGDPPTLQLADTRTGRAEVVARGIGRSLHRIPGRAAVSFVHKVSDEEWWIRALDPATREITPIARTLPGVEDLAWTPAGTLLMGRESTLYRWDAAAGEWRVAAELGADGVRGITRLAVSPRGEWLAVVGRRE